MITENYIKMCEQAEEIQKAWVPKAGDYVQLNKNKQIYLVSSVEKSKDKKKVVFYTNIINGNDSWCYIEFFKDNFIWLPTQEQLFEMLDVKNGKDLDLLIRKISYYEYRETNYFGCDVSYQKWCGIDNKYKYCDSINEMLLVMVYDLKYNKIWTGKKWEEVKTSE